MTVGGVMGWGGSVLSRLGAFLEDRLGFGGPGDGRPDEYRELGVAFDALFAAKERAEWVDAQKAETFLLELRNLWEDSVSYLLKREEYEQAKREIQARAGAAVERAQRMRDRFIQHVQVPDELERQRQRWTSASKRVRESASLISSLESVEGWSGRAADRYSMMAGVQTQATLEFADLPKTMANLLREVRNVHLHVLGEVHARVRYAVEVASVVREGAEDEFLINTVNVTHVIESCCESLEEVERQLAALSADLGEQAAQIRATPVVIAQGWPSGVALAGQIAHIAAGINPPRAPRAEIPATEGTLPGIRR